MTQVERGYLLIADIGGYTGYLKAVELEHAHDVLADLIGVVADGPKRHLCSHHTTRDLRVLHALICQHQPTRLFLGHGGPVDADAAAILTRQVIEHDGDQ
jgi:hypothetical protein